MTNQGQKKSDPFIFTRRVGFSDTDAMGVVHHMNYLRYFEEARVAWLRWHQLEQFHYPHIDLALAVTECRCRYFKPSRFDDHLQILVQVRSEGTQVFFQYGILDKEHKEQGSKEESLKEEKRRQPFRAVGMTTLVPVNHQLKVCRLPEELVKQLEKEIWTETWL